MLPGGDEMLLHVLYSVLSGRSTIFGIPVPLYNNQLYSYYVSLLIPIEYLQYYIQYDYCYANLNSCI